MKFTVDHNELLLDGVIEALVNVARLVAKEEDASASSTPNEATVEGVPGMETAATVKKPRAPKKDKAPDMSDADALAVARKFREKWGQKATTDIIKKYGGAWKDLKPADYAPLVADFNKYAADNGGWEDEGGNAGGDDPLA